MAVLPNPVRALIRALGWLLVRLGLLSSARAQQITALAWPRMVTGLARMSKATADVAMVGTALGPAAIAGVGYGVPFWTMTFMIGGGIAGGTISLVSQRYGAERHEQIGTAITVSAALALVATLPLVVLFWTFPEPLIRLIGTGDAAIRYGTDYLQIASLAIPFSALNLIASRSLIGADDAWTPMVVRAGGAVLNVAINAVLIFLFDLGVVGAALGTVVGSILSLGLFVWGLGTGRLPLLGPLPIRLRWTAPLWSTTDASHLLRVSTPLVLRKMAQNGGQFPMLAIVGLFGPEVVAAYVIALRVRALMNTPGWGFGLASSSLVGQALGREDDQLAELYAREAFRFTVAAFAAVAVAVFLTATPIVHLFVDTPEALGVTVPILRAACVSVLLWGVISGGMGPLRASGDTQWPFYGQILGLLVGALPAAYLGATTALGTWGLYMSLVLETGLPAAVIYYRYASGEWRRIGRAHRSATIGV
ncbi:MAG: MATE family efflux transporter [Bacteroidetes bacterium SW_9_63_38]|nr:MAG: MATE family efflux transporter [Bacteroidetes bacterium SW_9_63_38]